MIKNKTSLAEVIDVINNYPNLKLFSSPEKFMEIREEPDRPQPRLDRDTGKGMTVTIGRLYPDNIFDYRFVALSHNTLRGAAGGAILNAELLIAKGLI